LSPKAEADFLRQRRRRTEQSRRAIERPSHRSEVVFESVARKRFDQHQGPVFAQRVENVRRRADRIAHVVKAIKERYEIVILARVFFCFCNLETYAIRHSRI
jgi:hypothetical protein